MGIMGLPLGIELGEKGWQLLGSDAVSAVNMEQSVLALARQIGTVVVNGDYPEVMRISPQPGAQKSYYKTPGAIPLHTDEAWWPGVPSRYIIMGCERPADDGGVSILADARTTFLEGLSEDEQKILAETPLKLPAPPHHTDKAGLTRFGEVLAIMQPIVELDTDDKPSLVRLNPNQDFYDLNDDQPGAIEIVKKWDAANRGSAEHILLAAGQIIIMDNHRVVHARTAFTDPNRVQWRAYSKPSQA
jgi:alpha-ketoglutarate-dependent taurine dioxygenase